MMTASPGPVRSVAELRGRRAVVLGLARSGVAACRFLSDAGAVVAVYDRRPAAELAEAVAALGARPVRLALGVDEAAAIALLEHADLLVTSPSVSASFPTTDPWLRAALRAAEARGAKVVSEVGLFLRLTPARVLGVTGTKGKTTTASLVAAMLESASIPVILGGNIGTPLIERTDSLGRDDWAVLELSELQLPTIDRGAEIALYTNIGEDHLDRHGSVQAYRAVKARLAELSVPGGRIVLNRDDAGCRALATRLPAASIAWYGHDRPGLGPVEAWVADGAIVVAGAPLLPVAEVALPGRHLLSDVLGAALAATLVGADARAIGAAVRAFRGVAHRLELVAEHNGVRWYNDSQATIPVATVAALEAFGDTPLVVIAGGKDKGLAYHELADAIARHARAAVLIGETGATIEALIAGRVPVWREASMAEAVRRASDLAQPGDVALLSPAAASFDMFVDYAARGDAFREAVAQLGVNS